MLTVEVDHQTSGFDTIIVIKSDLPPLASFEARGTPEEFRQFVKAIKHGAYELDEHTNEFPEWVYRP